MVIKKFQQGGPVEQAPAQGGMEDQLMQLAQQLVEMLMQQIGDPQAVLAVLDMAAQMVSEAVAPEAGAAPAEGQQFMRAGGKVVAAKCGIKAKGGKCKKSSKKC